MQNKRKTKAQLENEIMILSADLDSAHRRMEKLKEACAINNENKYYRPSLRRHIKFNHDYGELEYKLILNMVLPSKDGSLIFDMDELPEFLAEPHKWGTIAESEKLRQIKK
jgi:hypothetical protein